MFNRKGAKMIEEYLKNKHAITSANSEEDMECLAGETIVSILPCCADPSSGEGWLNIFVFSSGCSFVQHSKGGFWVNDKEETKKVLNLQIGKLKSDAEKYATLQKLLQSL
jgi:hypothetical protein